MVSCVNKEIIEMILNREMKITDFDFEEPLNTWHDAFIVELLKWFNKKIEQMPEFKRDVRNRDKDWIEHWTNYYEQYVRILYYFVVYKNIQDSDVLSKIFRYLFLVNKDDNPYRDYYDMISSEKLMKVYKYLIMYTPNLKKDSEERECLDNVLVGIWNNKEIENRLERILIINVKTFDNYVLMTHLTISDDDYNEDNYYKYSDYQIPNFVLKEITTFEDSIKKIGQPVDFFIKKNNKFYLASFPVCRECASQRKCSKYGGHYPYDQQQTFIYEVEKT